MAIANGEVKQIDHVISIGLHQKRAFIACLHQSCLVFAGLVWSGFLTQKWAMGNRNRLPNSEISKNRDCNRLKPV